MKLKELKQLTKQEQLKLLTDTKSELFAHQLRLKAGELKNVSIIGRLKKSIARINTLVRMKK